MNSSNFRANARENLKGKWKTAILITLVYALLFFMFGIIETLLPVLGVIFKIVSIIIEVPLTFGLWTSYMKLYNGEEVNVFDFLNLGFANFSKSWSIIFQIALKLILPMVSVIVSLIVMFIGSIGYSDQVSYYNGGAFVVILIGLFALVGSAIWAYTKSYYYKLSYFIAIDDPSLSTKEIVNIGEKLMNKKRGKLFDLELSFLGWGLGIAAIEIILNILGSELISSIAVEICSFILLIYINFASIAFYKYIKNNTSQSTAEVISDNSNSQNFDSIQNDSSSINNIQNLNNDPIQNRDQNNNIN